LIGIGFQLVSNDFAPPLEKDGGFNRLNRIFDGQLETILGDINEELWQRKA
jgi:type I restriction enzyme R subunit